MEKTTITNWQFFLIVYQVTLGTAFFLLTTGIINGAQQYGFVVPFITGLTGICLSFMWFYIAKKHPELNLIEICLHQFGKFIGGIVSILYVFFFITITAWTGNNLADFIKTTLAPETSSWLVVIVFLAVAAYGVNKGFQNIARTGEFFIPLVQLAIFITLLLTLSSWDWSQFLPLNRFNLLTILSTSKIMLAFPYFELVCFMMIFPFVKKHKSKTFIYGVAAATVLLMLKFFIVIGVVGVSRGSRLIYPLFTLAQELEITEFLEHMEAFIAIAWLVSIFFKMTIFLYCAVVSLATLINTNNRKVISFPLIFLITGLSLSMHTNIIENIEWSNTYSWIFNGFFAVILPMLLLIMTWIRGGKSDAYSTSPRNN